MRGTSSWLASSCLTTSTETGSRMDILANASEGTADHAGSVTQHHRVAVLSRQITSVPENLTPWRKHYLLGLERFRVVPRTIVVVRRMAGLLPVIGSMKYGNTRGTPVALPSTNRIQGHSAGGPA